MRKVSNLSLNYAQLSAFSNFALETYNIFGRGQGKTMAMGLASQHVAHAFPRGKAVFVGRTYKQLLTLTVPEVISTWKKMGYIEDIHFVVGKKPSKNMGFLEPFQAPLDYQHFISWYNGFGMHLVGQDRGSFRGPSVDFVFADELLTLKKDHFEEEILGAKRGNTNIFGDIPFHSGIWASSSKPIGSSDRWFMSKGDYYIQDGKKYESLLEELVFLELELIDTKSKERRVKLWKDITNILSSIQYYKSKEGVYYQEARVWNNIKNLGWNWLKHQRRTMSKFKFMVEILNHTLKNVDGGFYGNLQLSKHVYYDSYDNNYIDELEFDFNKLKSVDSRFDADYNTRMPFIIGQDFGAAINYMVVGQKYNRELRFINEFFVLHPNILDDCIRKFCEYYKDHINKDVYYYFDHTGYNRQANSSLTLAEQAKKVFNSYGWRVYFKSGRRGFGHDEKYYIVNKCLQGDDETFIKILINGNNCPQLITSLQLAKVKQGRDKIEKDKSSERADSGVAPEDATHPSDAFDIPVVILSNTVNELSTFIPAPRTN